MFSGLFNLFLKEVMEEAWKSENIKIHFFSKFFAEKAGDP